MRPVSAFSAHVIHVVLMTANEQVRRIYAAAIVAVVTHVQAVRNAPLVQFIRETMHQSPLAVDAHHPVAVGSGVAGPVPTTLGFLDLFPETRHAVIAPAFLEPSATGRGVEQSDVMITCESNGLKGTKVQRRNHGSASTRTGDARHRENFGLAFLMSLDLVGASRHAPIIANV
jgi:hypothetical protein